MLTPHRHIPHRLILTLVLLSMSMQAGPGKHFCVPGKALFALGDDRRTVRMAPPKIVRVLNLGPGVNTPGNELSPILSEDETQLFFSSDRKGSKKSDSGIPSFDLYQCRIYKADDDAPYHPESLKAEDDTQINSSADETMGTWCQRSHQIYFNSNNRADGFGDADIYTADIDNSWKWTQIRNVGQVVNSQYSEKDVTVCRNSSRMYFSSNRPSTTAAGDFNIWASDFDYQHQIWKEAEELTTVNTVGSEVSPWIANDNRTLFYASQNPTSGFDMFLTHCAENGEWSQPVSMGPAINSNANELYPTYSLISNMLFFSSNRTDYPEAQGGYDLYVAFTPLQECSLDSNLRDTELLFRDTTTLVGRVSIDFDIRNEIRTVLQIPSAERVKFQIMSLTGEVEQTILDQDMERSGQYIYRPRINELPRGLHFFYLSVGKRTAIRRFAVCD